MKYAYKTDKNAPTRLWKTFHEKLGNIRDFCFADWSQPEKGGLSSPKTWEYMQISSYYEKLEIVPTELSKRIEIKKPSGGTDQGYFILASSA